MDSSEYYDFDLPKFDEMEARDILLKMDLDGLISVAKIMNLDLQSILTK